ncbi:hypothetical protein O181_095373, partial [Austropuccinia psidii MF-1]|nr:hypothetical protein [Austropuccinia psidii MF-1]
VLEQFSFFALLVYMLRGLHSQSLNKCFTEVGVVQEALYLIDQSGRVPVQTSQKTNQLGCFYHWSVGLCYSLEFSPVDPLQVFNFCPECFLPFFVALSCFVRSLFCIFSLHLILSKL